MTLAVVIHAADIQDRDGGRLALERLSECFPRLQLIRADDGYAEKSVGCPLDPFAWIVESVKKPEAGVSILPRRRGVERTFGWLGGYRRLTRDYQYNSRTAAKPEFRLP